jgi:hypothetical protein
MGHVKFCPGQLVYVRGHGETTGRRVIGALTPQALEDEFITSGVQPLSTEWPHYQVEGIPRPVSQLRISSKPIVLKK